MSEVTEMQAAWIHRTSIRLSADALLAALLVLLAFGAAAAVALAIPSSGDYALRAAVSGDNAAPGLAALLHGSFGAFADRQPLMGLGSLLLRLPFAALASSLGSSQLTLYRFGAFACMLPPTAFCAWLIWNRRSRFAGLLSAAFTCYVVLLAPTTINALGSGHPEEPLAAVLAAASVLAATRGRAVWAGLLLGLAIGTKEWTLVAVLPVLMALSRRRARAVGVALACASMLLLPQVLADPVAFTRASQSLGEGHLVSALSAWWPFGNRPPSLPTGAPLVGELPLDLSKSVALGIALALALSVATAAWIRLRGRAGKAEPMAVLALLALARCLGDPGPVEYYYVAVLIPLAAWEAAVLNRAPLLTALALGAVSVTFGPLTALPAETLSALMLAWSIPLAGYLAVQGFSLKRLAPRPIRATCEA